MPKGGLLHAHLDATVNVQVLLRLLTKHDVYYIAVTNAPLLVDNLASNLPQIEVFPPEYLLTMDTSITSDSYVLGTWVPFNQARQNFAFGGPEGFDNWLISLMTINPEEAYKTYNTSTKVCLSTLLSSDIICVLTAIADMEEVQQHIFGVSGKLDLPLSSERAHDTSQVTHSL